MPSPRLEIDIWRADLAEPGWPGAEDLPADERERAARLPAGQRRRRWVAARWALRGALAEYLDRDAAEIEIEVPTNGKPALSDRDRPRFSLSHSRDLAVVAISRGPEVGIDVEWIDPRRDLTKLAKRALPAEDAAGVAAAETGERASLFYGAWTRREAIGKCLGVGLGTPSPTEPSPASGISVCAFAPEPGYAAAIAVSADQAPPLRHFSIDPKLRRRELAA